MRRGDTAAAYTLGQRYLKGDTVEANGPLARIFLLYAANHDHAGAMLAIGTMYRDGVLIEAKEWHYEALLGAELDRLL